MIFRALHAYGIQVTSLRRVIETLAVITLLHALVGVRFNVGFKTKDIIFVEDFFDIFVRLKIDKVMSKVDSLVQLLAESSELNYALGIIAEAD